MRNIRVAHSKQLCDTSGQCHELALQLENAPEMTRTGAKTYDKSNVWSLFLWLA